jgi:hypothetical protein
MKRSLLALLAVLSGCAETPARNVASVAVHNRAAQYGTTTTIVDYAGLPCGDPSSCPMLSECHRKSPLHRRPVAQTRSQTLGERLAILTVLYHTQTRRNGSACSRRAAGF